MTHFFLQYAVDEKDKETEKNVQYQEQIGDDEGFLRVPDQPEHPSEAEDKQQRTGASDSVPAVQTKFCCKT